MKPIAHTLIISLAQATAFSAFAQTPCPTSNASSFGISSILASGAGIAALLAFLFAIRRDRQMKFAQTLFARLDEIQKSVAAMVSSHERAKSTEELIEGLAEGMASQLSTQEGELAYQKQRETYLEKVKDDHAVIAESARITMLIAMSTSKWQRNRELENTLMDKITAADSNSVEISMWAATYIKAEADWILHNNIAEFLRRAASHWRGKPKTA